MMTYLIQETRRDVNVSQWDVDGGINTPLQLAVLNFGLIKIKEEDLDVVFSLVVLGGIINKILAAWMPVHPELSLLYSVYNQIEPHVHGFGHFLLDGLIGHSYICGVVHLDGSGRLWTVHFNQSGAYGYCLFGVKKKGIQFHLCC